MKVAILGGTGRMGAWFARYFKRKGCDVVIWARTIENLVKVAEEIGVSYALSAEEAVKDADLVLVSVPISAVPEVVKKISPHVKRGAIVFDVASVKGKIPEVLREEGVAHGYKAASLHPMFGPGAKGIEGNKIVVIPLEGFEETAKWLADYFAEEGAEIIFSDAETHDRIVALTLALPHFVNIFFALLLSDLNVNPEELRKFSGTTFSVQFTLSESVLQENPNVYAEIQMENEKFKHVLERGKAIFEALSQVVYSGNKEKFTELFSKAREWTQGDRESREAYRKMYQIIEALRKGGRQGQSA
ncbi:MAG: prephenate dehydrogenase/arogenate dehydrogenase family protein [Candidatus Jordarchaeales archaeon]